MNNSKNIKLNKLKFNIYLETTFTMFVLFLTFSGCKKENDKDISMYENPFLKVVNQTNDGNSRSITNVKLDGYEFTNLNIVEGSSQTFELKYGIYQNGYGQDGVTNINVRLSGPEKVSENIEVHFNLSETVIITMKGCLSLDGCNGFYLE